LNPDTSALLDRAASFERSGAWGEAAVALHTAYAASVQRQDLSGILEAVVRLGHCMRLAGDPDLSSDALELACTLGELNRRDDIAGRALNGLGMLAFERGASSEATRLYAAANELGRRAGDQVLVAETEQNLGILANIRGDLDEARTRYETALRHLDVAGPARGRISALNNLGMLHLYRGELADALGYFDRALAVSLETGDVVRTAMVHVNRAELFLARGELARAREACDDGFEIFSRLNDEFHQAQALKLYGVIYRESGKLHLATIHLQRAIEIARPRDSLVEAQAQREMSRVLRLQGSNRQALEALNRSHTLFTSLQARPDLADLDKRVADLEEEFLGVVRVWGESIEAKDRYTLGHCARVADYACRIAERAGMTDRELTWFRMGAFLHDVGKTEVPEEILNKPGRLTDEERATMERHTVIGDEMLAPVEFPWDIRPMVRSHHERWDGRGYPDQLVAEAIPRSARILRLADVFDALTTARSYRAPLTPERALGIMRDDQGSFDPELFQIFLDLYDEFAPTAAEAASSVSA
jgi:putative nucleotidyltransferase with HDIG domain